MGSTTILSRGGRAPKVEPTAGHGMTFMDLPAQASPDQPEKGAPAVYVEASIASGRRRFCLDPSTVCRLGRSDQNGIVVRDQLVSRHHAMIQPTEAGEFHLIDLGSRNGTFVNNRRVTVPVVLKPGDRLTVGEHEFVFYQTTEPGPAPADYRASAGASTRVAMNLQLISVLVVDIRDYTGLARRLDEATLAQTIGTFIRKSGTALVEQGAWAQKYIGDAVMSVWLHQSSTPALKELLAVLEGLAKLIEAADGLQAEFGLVAPIRVGGGINTGVASIGNVGSAAVADHTALGDVVNKAFRLESATKELHRDLAVGQATYDFLAETPGVAELFEQHMVTLKGYREPSPAYSLPFSSLEKLLALLRAKA
jgi:adenylate cyclase